MISALAIRLGLGSNMKAVLFVLVLATISTMATDARAEGGCGPYRHRNWEGYCVPYGAPDYYNPPRDYYNRGCPPRYYLAADGRCYPRW
jgi:hypothetical protein